MEDYYKTLGVSRRASSDEIQKAFRDLAKILHPDLNPGNEDVATKFKDASSAYDTLKDPEKRTKYDRELSLGINRSNEVSQSRQRENEEEKRRNEETKRRYDELARELAERRRARDKETRQKEEFDERVNEAWQERLSNLSFREKAKRRMTSNWDFIEYNALKQKMEKEARLEKIEQDKSRGQQKFNDIKEELKGRQEDIKKETFGQKYNGPEMRPMKDWKPEPEVRRSKDWSPDPEVRPSGFRPAGKFGSDDDPDEIKPMPGVRRNPASMGSDDDPDIEGFNSSGENKG